MTTLLDAPVVPQISEKDRAERLSAAGAAWSDRIDKNRSSAQLTYRVEVVLTSDHRFDLIGGGRVLLIGNVIQDQFLVARNWPLGSVLALVLLLLLVLLLVAQSMVIRRIQGGSK